MKNFYKEGRSMSLFKTLLCYKNVFLSKCYRIEKMFFDYINGFWSILITKIVTSMSVRYNTVIFHDKDFIVSLSNSIKLYSRDLFKVFFLDEKNGNKKNQGLAARLNKLPISYQRTNSLRSDKFVGLTEIVAYFKRLAQPRPISLAYANNTNIVRATSNNVVFYVESRNVFFSSDSSSQNARPVSLACASTNTLTSTNNVAFKTFEKRQEEALYTHSKVLSDTLLGTSGKTKVPCPSGIEDITSRYDAQSTNVFVLRSQNARPVSLAFASRNTLTINNKFAFDVESRNVFFSSDGKIYHQKMGSEVGETLNASASDVIGTKSVLMRNECRTVRQIALEKDKGFGYLSLFQVSCPAGREAISYEDKVGREAISVGEDKRIKEEDFFECKWFDKVKSISTKYQISSNDLVLYEDGTKDEKEENVVIEEEVEVDKYDDDHILCTDEVDTYTKYLASQIYEHQLRLKPAAAWQELANIAKQRKSRKSIIRQKISKAISFNNLKPFAYGLKLTASTIFCVFSFADLLGARAGAQTPQQGDTVSFVQSPIKVGSPTEPDNENSEKTILISYKYIFNTIANKHNEKYVSRKLIKNYPLVIYDFDYKQTPNVKIGDELPAFLKAIAFQYVDSDGETKIGTLSEFMDSKLLILDFWATWCSPCVESMDKWNVIANEIDGVKVLGVMLDHNIRAQYFGASRDWVLPILYGPETNIINSFFFDRPVISRSAWIMNGKLIGITNTKGYDTEVVRDLINGKSVDLPMAYEWIYSTSN